MVASLALYALALLVDPQNLSRHTRALASDRFEGRAPGTAGEARTVAYLIDQLRAAGVAPGAGGGGWTQGVHIQRFTLPEPPRLQARGARCDLTLGPDEVVLWTKRPAARVALAAAPLVFVGHGVAAPGWDDYAAVDARGKVALVLANDPDYEAPSGPFEGPAMSHVGRMAYKAEEAARRGALAVLTINHPAATGYSWEQARALFSVPARDVQGPGPARVAFEGLLRQEAAARLLRCADLDLEALRKAAARPGFRGRPVGDLALSAGFPVQVAPSRTRNVIGIVRGAQRPLETFVYTAHWDHLGRGKPDSSGDTIYNGALDNAAGVAGLLELGRLFAAGPRPRRSVLLIATTLEESGLLGAEYYASHPLYPLETTVGGINMDAVNLFGPTGTMEVTGLGRTTLEDLLGEALARGGRRMQPDPNAAVGFYYRSDHFPFARRGVPFLFAGSGWELAEARFPNRRDPQVGTRFHQPSDEWSPDMDFAAAARDMQVYYEVGRRLVDSAAWPGWRPGAEFKALRDASAARRGG